MIILIVRVQVSLLVKKKNKILNDKVEIIIAGFKDINQSKVFMKKL